MRWWCCSSNPSMSPRVSACISIAGQSWKPGTSSRNFAVRFRPELRVIGLVLLLAVAAPALPDAKPVTPAEIDHAIDAVKKDPNLANKQTVRTLRWDATPEKEKKKKEKKHRSFEWPDWLSWIGDVFGWIGESSRMLM